MSPRDFIDLLLRIPKGFRGVTVHPARHRSHPRPRPTVDALGNPGRPGNVAAMKRNADARADAVLDVVVDLLETEGYEAVQVRAVARRARISLTTLYQRFGTLD